LTLDTNQVAVFERYRGEALGRLKQREYRYRPSVLDVAAIGSISARYDVDEAVLIQMGRDLRVYLLYDALAMWLDPVAGLAPHAPEMLEETG